MTLNDDDLTYMRGTQSLLLPDLAAISEKVHAPDGFGGQTEAWVAQPAPVPCRIAAPTAHEAREIQGRVDLGEAWSVSMPVDTDVREGYRLTIQGEVYEVSIVFPAANWQTAQRLIVRRA